jgi:hypothetical protein
MDSAVLVPAYAATIHKSQRSKYPAVVIPVLTQHYQVLQRNLLYIRRDPWQAPRRPGRPEEGGRDRRPQRIEPTSLSKLGEWLSAGAGAR